MSKGPVNKHYLGINRKVCPSQLDLYEDAGFVIQEKFDGWWCCIDSSGVTSRYGNLIEAAPEVAKDYPFTLIGEWMPDEGIVHVHDIIGQQMAAFHVSYMFTALHKRRELLEDTVLGDWMRLVPQYDSGFKHVYDGIIADKGEGVVLKHEDSFYNSRLKSQKTGMWVKCKPEYAEQQQVQYNNPFVISSGAVT